MSAEFGPVDGHPMRDDADPSPIVYRVSLSHHQDTIKEFDMAKSRSSAMSDAHKEALAIGRAESRAVRKYLEALEAHKPKRGRKRTPESIRSKLSKIEAQLPEASPLDRLQLIQERLDLQNELERLENRVDPSDLEGEFAKAAKGYSDRKGISYAAWRELGVPAATLKKAGISRGS